MKAVQAHKMGWFVPERGGSFFYNDGLEMFMYAESGNDSGLPVGRKDLDLPAFLRRCGYTLVWLDGRVESAEAKEG